MPLLDHFHPPLHGPRRWEGFHHAWATFIAQQLNQDTLPSDYYAESEISVGPELEIDVATMEQVDNGNRNKDPNAIPVDDIRNMLNLVADESSDKEVDHRPYERRRIRK